MIQFAVIGGGVMGEAILSRLLAQSIYLPSTVLVSEPRPERRSFLANQYGVEVTDNNRLVASAETILLAVKPQILKTVAHELMVDSSTEKPLLLSILAGVRLHHLETLFPKLPVVRAMPNTPAIIGAGVTAISSGQSIQPHHLALTHQIFQAVGQVLEVPESLMDAVTGLSGSSPAFIAIVIEALTDGGVLAGLPRAIAAELALQTVLGTAKLIQEKGIHPAVLKDQVTSPGGTTIGGIQQLERGGLRSALMNAVKTASDRAQELGN